LNPTDDLQVRVLLGAGERCAALRLGKLARSQRTEPQRQRALTAAEPEPPVCRRAEREERTSREKTVKSADGVCQETTAWRASGEGSLCVARARR
jgi:hypothetical protein